VNAHQRRVSMTRRHRDWPLGTPVLVNARGLQAAVEPDVDTSAMIADRERQLLHGRVVKHWRGNDYACSVEFVVPVDLGGAIWPRYAHRIPFRRLRKTEAAA
jgi:hypothetical protein